MVGKGRVVVVWRGRDRNHHDHPVRVWRNRLHDRVRRNRHHTRREEGRMVVRVTVVD